MAEFENYIERYISTCIEYEDSFDLVCMQCNGQFKDRCSFRDISDSCYYKVRTTEKV